MKLLFSEHPASYDTYSFPYQVWALEESHDNKAKMFNMGFLPTRFKIGLWYMARSSRVNLSAFEISSENRRILKNTEQFSPKIIQSSEFSLDSNRIALIRSFIDTTIETDFSDASIKRICSPHLSQIIIEWYENDTLVGLSPIMETNASIFYWYGFYDNEKQKSGIGMRMMLEALTWAQSNDKAYAYIGTIYTKSSLYKTNFNGLEFYNGIDWSTNEDELKEMIERDTDQSNPEAFKDPHYLQIAYDSKNIGELLKKLQ